MRTKIRVNKKSSRKTDFSGKNRKGARKEKNITYRQGSVAIGRKESG